MDARELTKVVNELTGKVDEQSKQIRYLTDEMEKLRMMVKDMSVDVKQMTNPRR